MSVYRRARRFSNLIWVLLFLAPVWAGVLIHLAGITGIVLVIAAWASLGVVSLLCFRCPRCRNPAFRYRALKRLGYGGILIWGPFPKRQCGVCSFDLDAQ